jgi:hypothetical protein
MRPTRRERGADVLTQTEGLATADFAVPGVPRVLSGTESEPDWPVVGVGIKVDLLTKLKKGLPSHLMTQLCKSICVRHLGFIERKGR